MPEEFRDNPAQNRFELAVEGGMAFAYYRLEPDTIVFVHTEVPQALSGRGVGSRLIRTALEAARAQGRKVVAQCSFVSAYLGKHPEFNDLIK
jgi:uncharacterized protein